VCDQEIDVLRRLQSVESRHRIAERFDLIASVAEPDSNAPQKFDFVMDQDDACGHVHLRSSAVQTTSLCHWRHLELRKHLLNKISHLSLHAATRAAPRVAKN
jgi:hypothetical protein